MYENELHKNLLGVNKTTIAASQTHDTRISKPALEPNFYLNQ